MENDALSLQCPVCKGFIGYKSIHNIQSAHCDECRATFLFERGKSIPFKALLDTKAKKTCTCISCQNR
jgi:hypothetical protein